MARPREYDGRTTTALRIPPDLHGRLKEAAAERGLSANRLILLAAEEFLDRLIPVDEFTYTRQRGAKIGAGEGNGQAGAPEPVREALDAPSPPPPVSRKPRGGSRVKGDQVDSFLK